MDPTTDQKNHRKERKKFRFLIESRENHRKDPNPRGSRLAGLTSTAGRSRVGRPTSRRLTGAPALRCRSTRGAGSHGARPPPRGKDASRCARGRILSTRALGAQGAVPEPLDGGALATASAHAGEGARGGAISSDRRSVCSGREIRERGSWISGRERRQELPAAPPQFWIGRRRNGC